MNERALIVHALPARTRLRIPGRKGDSSWFVGLSDALSRVPEVQAIRINARAGTLLVLHDPDTRGAILERASRAGWFETPLNAMASQERFIETLADNFSRWGDHASRQGVDLKLLTFVGLLIMGGIQIRRGQFMAPAATAFWYAYELLRRSRPH